MNIRTLEHENVETGKKKKLAWPLAWAQSTEIIIGKLENGKFYSEN